MKRRNEMNNPEIILKREEAHDMRMTQTFDRSTNQLNQNQQVFVYFLNLKRNKFKTVHSSLLSNILEQINVSAKVEGR